MCQAQELVRAPSRVRPMASVSVRGNGVHPTSKVGEHGHAQAAQDVPQGQLAKNSISNGPHELEL